MGAALSRGVRMDIELEDLKHEIGGAQRQGQVCCIEQEIKRQAGINLQLLAITGRNISCRIIRTNNDPCLKPFLARSTTAQENIRRRR